MAKRLSVGSAILRDVSEIELQFIDAVYNYNMSKISLCLENGVNPNIIMSKSRKTALHFAAELPDTTFTILLLSTKKINLDIANDRGFTALHKACMFKNSNVASLLLEYGACKNCLTKTNRTPLHISAEFGDIGTSKILLDYGADPNRLDDYYATPLSIASLDCGNYHLTELLLQHDADPVLDRGHLMQLFLELVLYAQNSVHVSIITLFLKHEKLHINMTDEKFGKTCLHYVALTAYFDLAYLLLSYGADRTIKDLSGKTPLQTAAKYKNYDIVRLFEKFGGPGLYDNVAREEMHRSVFSRTSDHSGSCFLEKPNIIRL